LDSAEGNQILPECGPAGAKVIQTGNRLKRRLRRFDSTGFASKARNCLIHTGLQPGVDRQ